VRRIQIQLVITTCMLIALVFVGGRSLAQMRQAVQSDRDERRIERKVEDLQKDQGDLKKAHDDLRLDIEKRLTRIETYMYAGLWLLGGITLAVVGQLVTFLSKGARALFEQLRAAEKGKT